MRRGRERGAAEARDEVLNFGVYWVIIISRVGLEPFTSWRRPEDQG